MSNENKYDLVMFGATGFTGKLVCEYINSKYSDSLNWAIAGRNKEKLENVSNELGLSVPTIELDSNNESHVENVLKQTRLILTTVGPYQLYGNEIIKKCAELGVHYVDLSGEPGWMHLMNEHKAQAQQSGAKIVHSCGFDSIPSDLGVLFLQNEAKNKHGRPYANVKCRVRSMKGEFSGGTAASLRATLGSLKTNPEMFNILVDPFTLCEGFKGPDQPVDNKPYYDEVLQQWSAPFFMAPINTKNVHRSNYQLNFAYGEDFLYEEMFACGEGEKGEAAAKAIASYNPMMGENVPKPGEGPSKESRDNGSYDMAFYGVVNGKVEMTASVIGQGDPGYSSTSKMITESALCLLNDCDDLPGGIYSTASSMGTKLIKRLEDNDVMKFTLEDDG